MKNDQTLDRNEENIYQSTDRWINDVGDYAPASNLDPS